jgi:hypothetical protein
MCFLIALLGLLISLFAGAFIAPRSDGYRGPGIDFCAPGTGASSMFDRNCANRVITLPVLPSAHRHGTLFEAM